ncbi:hypothetical protein ACLOJK_040636 [Asimina triloba]
MQTTAVVADIVDVVADLDQMIVAVNRDGMGEDGGSGAVSVGGAGRRRRRMPQQGQSTAVTSGDGCGGVGRWQWPTVSIGLTSGGAAAGTDDGRPRSTDLGLAGDGDEGSNVGENRR